MTKAEVKVYKGRPTIFVNGEALPFVAYSPVAGRRPELYREQSARFFAHGASVYLLTPPSGKSETEWCPHLFWDGESITGQPVRVPDSDFDSDVEYILKGNPQAYLVLRSGSDESQSWRDLHAEELFVNDEGTVQQTPSMASDLFVEMRGKCAKAWIGYYEGKPWADRIIGYWNGDRVEGSHEPVMHGWFFDHSPVMLKKWHEFLKGKYGTVEALRKAHGVEGADFESYDTPRDANRGAIRDVEKRLYWPSEAAVRDYVELNAALYHRRLRELAKATKEACGGRERVLVYDCLKQWMQGWSNYGFFERNFSWPLAFPDMLAGSGHIGIAPLLLTEGLSGLITPHDYQARGIGGVYENEGASDSCVLRGKIFFSEMDTRSWTGTDVCFPARNQQEFAAITWRNLATAWSRGFQNYWMDVYQDWFADATMHKEVIAPQARAQRQSLEWAHEDEPCIAVILDDHAALDTDIRGNYLNEGVLWEVRQGLARCGVPHRIYMLDDLELDNFPKHRVFWIPTLFNCDARKRALLEKKVLRDNHVVVWSPATNVCNGAEGATALTGFQMELISANLPRRVIVTNFEHPLTRPLDTATIYGGAFAYGPVLAPLDGERLGDVWLHRGLTRAGLAVKEMQSSDGQTWKSVFTMAHGLPAGFWREAARLSGTHVWNEANDVVVGDRSIVGVHTLKAGTRTVKLPFTAKRVTDVITDTLYAENTDTITWTAPACPDTRVFHFV